MCKSGEGGIHGGGACFCQATEQPRKWEVKELGNKQVEDLSQSSAKAVETVSMCVCVCICACMSRCSPA